MENDSILSCHGFCFAIFQLLPLYKFVIHLSQASKKSTEHSAEVLADLMRKSCRKFMLLEVYNGCFAAFLSETALDYVEDNKATAYFDANGLLFFAE
ncbi:hypothetical protein CUMW_217720 [Citrus unshiu]|nr:hypothetical protein CUMW_217720 [Citrus unshiu]